MERDVTYFVDNFGLKLTNLCLKLCRSQNDAQDLYQDTWLAIIKNFNSYDQTRPFDKWSYSVCINTYKNIYNKRKRDPIPIPDIPLGSHDSGNQLIIREAIDLLDDKLRLVVILYYFDDLALEDVAKVLKIPQGTAKFRLFKAREVLKRRLSANE